MIGDSYLNATSRMKYTSKFGCIHVHSLSMPTFDHAKFLLTILQGISHSSRNTSHPSPLRVLLSTLQLACRNIPSLEHNALSCIPPSIIPPHPESQSKSNRRASKAKAGADNTGHLVPRCGLLGEDIRSNQPHCIGSGNHHRRQNSTLIFIGSIVVIPG